MGSLSDMYQVVLMDEAGMEVATTIAEALRVMGTTSIMDAAQHAQRKARYRFDTVVVWREVGAGREVSFGLRGYCWSVFAERSVWVSKAADAALKEQRELQKQGAVSGKRAADVLSSFISLRGSTGSQKSSNLARVLGCLKSRVREPLNCKPSLLAERRKRK